MKAKKKTKKKNPLAKFTDAQLLAELSKRGTDTATMDTANKVVNGFSTKDLVCIQGDAQSYEEENRGYKDPYGPHYSFYLRVDGKLFDIYYQNCVTGEYDDRQGVEPSRWPESDDDGWNYVSLDFVPTEFSEASENMYEYHGKLPVEKYLKKLGIEFRIWNPELNDEETGEDKNYA